MGSSLMVLQACGGRAVERDGDAQAGSLGAGASDSDGFSPGGFVSAPGTGGGFGMTTPGGGTTSSGGRPSGRSGASTGGRAVGGHAGVPSLLGGAPVVGGAPGVGGEASSCESAGAGGALLGCDFGRPCQRNADCTGNDCYFPGTGENPICAERCVTSTDCPSGSACTGPFGAPRHCFVLCHDTATCQAINSNPINPLECVDMADPQAPQGQTVCAQSSEP